MNTALAAAMAGKPVSDKQAPRALAEAAEKLASLKEKFATVKENAGETATAALHVGETLTTVFAASTAEGYFGEDKMLFHGVPYRGVTGAALGGWGLARTLMGKPGGHQLAFATGLLAVDVAMLGRKAGAAIRSKRGLAPASNGSGAPTPSQQALIQANPGAYLLNGKVVTAQGAALEGDDLASIARLIATQPGTAGEPRRALPEGAPRRRS